VARSNRQAVDLETGVPKAAESSSRESVLTEGS